MRITSLLALHLLVRDQMLQLVLLSDLSSKYSILLNSTLKNDLSSHFGIDLTLDFMYIPTTRKENIKLLNSEDRSLNSDSQSKWRVWGNLSS